THGWDTPVLNDRAAPQYPRHQALTQQEMSLVDNNLDRLAAQVK
ncbi:MAG: gamma-glutamylcyclotransferase, partial [Sulfitobacter sp.]|nr:gamma-glutamylcyclotransferase [Sulfitobacter sp.]